MSSLFKLQKLQVHLRVLLEQVGEAQIKAGRGGGGGDWGTCTNSKLGPWGPSEYVFLSYNGMTVMDT